MARVLKSTQSCHFPSPSSSCVGSNDGNRDSHSLFNIPLEEEERSEKERERFELSSSLEILASAIRKSLIGGCVGEEINLSSMEIGVPTDVRHVAHVTFDRFHGFLGLPVEFEPEVPTRPPSASAKVFGVSTESMQLSYDTRGNVVPTILLMMQSHLYSRGGLRVEGIFRINGENGQEEYVREELNKGVVPDNIDVHCLASLIKAWFRELPTGVLDSLSPEKVMESEGEGECVELVRMLPATEASLLDWSINLMADVVEMECLNKMNARNIAMVFAPNMTQMLDPLTALMYAVQVMNFLKTLIVKTLKDRKESRDRLVPGSNPGPRDANGDQSSRQLLHLIEANKEEAVDTFEALEMKDKEESEVQEPREILAESELDVGAEFLESNTALSMDQEIKLREMGATTRNGGSFTQKLKLDEDKQRKAMNIMKKMNVERLSELIAFYTLMGKISSEVLERKLNGSLDDHSLTSQ